jgi:hypothetical protein
MGWSALENGPTVRLILIIVVTEAGGGAIGGVLSRFIALGTDLSNAQGSTLRT